MKNYMLSYYTRIEVQELIKRPWWKIFSRDKLQTVLKDIRKSYTMTEAEYERYIQNYAPTGFLLRLLGGKYPVWNLQVEEAYSPASQYIPTTGTRNFTITPTMVDGVKYCEVPHNFTRATSTINLDDEGILRTSAGKNEMRFEGEGRRRVENLVQYSRDFSNYWGDSVIYNDNPNIQLKPHYEDNPNPDFEKDDMWDYENDTEEWDDEETDLDYDEHSNYIEPYDKWERE